MKNRILQPTALLALILQMTGPGSALAPAHSEAGSPHEVIRLVYSLVSGPAGQPRDWDRYRSLYRPGARLITQGASGRSYDLTVEDYIRDYGPLFSSRGIVEEQISQRQLRFGNLVHIWSAYQFRWLDDESDRGRGIASFQLLFEQGRWRIASLLWQMESQCKPLPKEQARKHPVRSFVSLAQHLDEYWLSEAFRLGGLALRYPESRKELRKGQKEAARLDMVSSR